MIWIPFEKKLKKRKKKVKKWIRPSTLTRTYFCWAQHSRVLAFHMVPFAPSIDTFPHEHDVIQPLPAGWMCRLYRWCCRRHEVAAAGKRCPRRITTSTLSSRTRSPLHPQPRGASRLGVTFHRRARRHRLRS